MVLDTSTALVAPAPAMRIDEAALHSYLRAAVPGFPAAEASALQVFQFAHGQSNPTYLVKAGGRTYVLRKKPPGKVLPSAHAVEREYRVLAALQGTPVPVPRTVALCEDPSVLGTPFYLMEHMRGVIHADPALPGVAPAERTAIYQAMARTLAALHSVDPRAVGLAGYGKPAGYNRRQVWRWGQQYLKSVQGEPMPEVVGLMRWLEGHLPEGDDNPAATRISHGDYRLDNLVLDESRPGRVLAVLDWELSTLGDPLADLAYSCLPYHMPAEVPSLPSLPRPLPAGIPEEQQYIRWYCEARGLRYPLQADWPFYVGLSLFRLCSILAGVGARAAQGNASSRIAGQVGADAVVRSLAQAGLRIVGAAPAPAPGLAAGAPSGHAVLSGTPLEPYVNPRHPNARPDPNPVYAGNPLEEYANPSTAWQSAAGAAQRALAEADAALPSSVGYSSGGPQRAQRGAAAGEAQGEAGAGGAAQGCGCGDPRCKCGTPEAASCGCACHAGKGAAESFGLSRGPTATAAEPKPAGCGCGDPACKCGTPDAANCTCPCHAGKGKRSAAKASPAGNAGTAGTLQGNPQEPYANPSQAWQAAAPKAVAAAEEEGTAGKGGKVAGCGCGDPACKCGTPDAASCGCPCHTGKGKQQAAKASPVGTAGKASSGAAGTAGPTCVAEAILGQPLSERARQQISVFITHGGADLSCGCGDPRCNCKDPAVPTPACACGAGGAKQAQQGGAAEEGPAGRSGGSREQEAPCKAAGAKVGGGCACGNPACACGALGTRCEPGAPGCGPCRAGAQGGAGTAGASRLSGHPTAAAAAPAGAGRSDGPRISEETAEGGIVGAPGEFVREGLAGVAAGGDPLPVGRSVAASPGLGPSPRVQPILKKLRAFMDEHVYPAEATLTAHAHSPERWTIHPLQEELKARAKAAGLWNLWIPADMAAGLAPLLDSLGLEGGERAALLGPGLTNLEYAHCAEVMGRSGWAPEVFNCSAPDTGNMEVLARYGSLAQQRAWLVPLLRGEIRSAFAMTEPEVASSDATNIRGSIQRTPEGGYLLNGRKWWTSGACDPRCSIAIFMGKSDPSGPAHAQQSMVLVPMDAPGVTVIRPLPVFGYDDAPHGHAEVDFQAVRVPGENMILGEGRGFEIAQGRLGPGRLHHCMRTLGAAERALELMVQRSGERTAFGAPLYKHQSVRLDIAQSRIELDAARLVVLEAARALDEVGNKAARGKIAAAKALAPSAALRIIDRAIQVHGGAGVSDGTPLAHMWAGIRTLRLADGPDVVHLETIAKLELSLAAKRAGRARL